LDGIGDFVMIGSTGSRKFVHSPIQTGRTVVYIVRSRRGGSVSLFSAEASIYASASVNPLKMEKAA